MSRKSGRITPLRGSPTGRVILNGSEEHNTFDEPTIPDVDFGKEETRCYCGLSFPEHTTEELAYIHEHRRCLRLSRLT